MTVPNGDLGDALRRQLSAAADAVEPAADGLERIRARTAKHQPQPWLVSVLSGAVTRARYWVWRGHWSWSPPRLPSLSLSRAKGAPATAWLRPVAVLAGVAFLAAITLAVPPLRQAIVQVSNNLTGSQQSGGSGTDGNGSPTGNGGGGTLSTGARSTSSAGPSGSQSGTRGPTVTSSCKPTAGTTAKAGSATALPVSAVESNLPGTLPASCPSGEPASTPVSVPSRVTTSVPTSVPTTSTPTTSPTPTTTGSPTPTTTPTTSPTATGTGTATPSTSASDGATGVVGS